MPSGQGILNPIPAQLGQDNAAAYVAVADRAAAVEKDGEIAAHVFHIDVARVIVDFNRPVNVEELLP